MIPSRREIEERCGSSIDTIVLDGIDRMTLTAGNGCQGVVVEHEDPMIAWDLACLAAAEIARYN